MKKKPIEDMTLEELQDEVRTSRLVINTLKPQTFTEWLKENSDETNLFPPPLEAQKAVNFLEKYLLGDDWYIVNPLTNEQANVEVVQAILEKYSRKYRREYRNYIRNNK